MMVQQSHRGRLSVGSVEYPTSFQSLACHTCMTLDFAQHHYHRRRNSNKRMALKGWGMAQWIKGLLHKHGDLNQDPQHPCQKASMGVPACGSAWGAETRSSQEPASPSDWSAGQLQVQ